MAESTIRDPRRNRLPQPPVDGSTILRLYREDTPSALEQLGRYSAEQIAGALLTLPPARRVEVLELSERAHELVPLLPAAEFTTTVRGGGIEEYGWLVGLSTPEQRVAAVDLDCWRDFRFSPSRLLEWIDAMIAAGPETLVAAFDELDLELWVLAMRSMGRFSAFGFGQVREDEGASEDGVIFYDAHSAEDEERIRAILRTALHYSPSHYRDLAYGAVSESVADCEQLAGRWQRHRLADLGFPERDQAMLAYRPLAVEETPVLDLPPEDEHVPVRASTIPVPQPLGGSLVGTALAELSPTRAHEVMGGILAVANSLAVADRLPLSEPETVETSLAKAVRGIDRGLAEVARARSQEPAVALAGTPPLDLFRIGATLDPALRPSETLADLLAEEESEDWNVRTEEISEADRTLGRDGRPNE